MAKAIEIENLSYKYTDGTDALMDVSLSVEHGEKVALIGPNGAGKSTLLLAMNGFIKTTGSVFVDGLELNRKNMRKIRRCIGSCMENPDDQLFMPTLFDDVAFGPLNMGLEPEEVKLRITEALGMVGLSNMTHKAPHHLSAGQKRAAAIATILSMRPKIITLDEPDGSLDPANRNKLLTLLKRLPQTTIIATCNMTFAAAIAERAVLMDAGQIITDGHASKIMADKELMIEHGLEIPYKIE